MDCEGIPFHCRQFHEVDHLYKYYPLIIGKQSEPPRTYVSTSTKKSMEVDSSLVAHSEEPLPSRSRDGAVTQQTDSWTSEALVTRSQSRGTEPISSTLPPSSLVSQDCLLSGIGLSSVVVLGSGIRASNLCFINCPVATTPPAPVHSSSTLHLDLLPLASMEGTTSSGSHPYNLRPYPFPEPFLFSWMRTLSLPYL